MSRGKNGPFKPTAGYKHALTPLQVCIIVFQQLHYLDLAGIGRWASGSSEAASLRRYAKASHAPHICVTEPEENSGV